MFTLIEFPVGVIVEAFVLSAGQDRMRVAIAGLPDAMELRRAGAGWITEDAESVSFGFLQRDAAPAVNALPREAPAVAVGMAFSPVV
jgi:hypothetical protein